MEVNIHEISNAVMIDSLDAIIQQESLKLEIDKSGLQPKKSKLFKIQQALEEKGKMVSLNIPFSKDTKSHSPKLNSSNSVNEVERLENLFTQSPEFFTTKYNNKSTDNQALLKENKATKKHNEFRSYKVLLNNDNNTNFKAHLISPDIKVRRIVRFGEYSPLNPANQVNSQPFIGIGEYDDKKKKLLELQKKEYIEHLSKVKQEKSTSHLPKLASYSCEEALKTAMEDNNSSEQIKMYNNTKNNQDDRINLVPYVDGIETCTLDEDRIKEATRLKQELYRLELTKQIEEKKQLELERKRKEQLEDEAIERMAREQEEKIRKEFEKEAEKQTLAQLQKQLQQEKLKNEIMQKQKELESKSRNMAAETISRQESKRVPSRHQSFEDNNVEEFRSPSQSTFDNVPLPTTRVRVPRKILYDDEDNRKTRDVSCNTEKFKNPYLNQNISPPVMKPRIERAHVSFARDPPMKRNERNPAVLLPITKSVIIDSPHTLALAGRNDTEESNLTCESIEPTEAAYRNQACEELLEYNHELTIDKHLLSNLANIRKQLDIEHQKLKQQVRKSQ